MRVWRRKQPSAAKAEFIRQAVTYGLKAVPFREASFSAAALENFVGLYGLMLAAAR
jgi:hypothetical protein